MNSIDMTCTNAAGILHAAAYRKPFTVKDPVSALTHFIGMIVSATGAIPLLYKAAQTHSLMCLTAMFIYALSLIALYGASSAYHTFDISPEVNKKMKKIDHMMISVLIAGSYTPICLLTLGNTIGMVMLSIVWALALVGILINIFWIFCPKWASSVLYIGMGWTCVIGIPSIYRAFSPAAFGWLLAGGIMYTIGGVIYALKLSVFNGKHQHFGSHEIFHVFVMFGSLCHYIVMYSYVL